MRQHLSSLLKAVITAFPSVSLPFLAVPLRSQRTLVAISMVAAHTRLADLADLIKVGEQHRRCCCRHYSHESSSPLAYQYQYGRTLWQR
eukprot:SAG22_NODE_991_length_6129_cov_8.370813_7_plen_89_part_00